MKKNHHQQSNLTHFFSLIKKSLLSRCLVIIKTVSLSKQDLIDFSYVVLGSVLGVISTILFKMILIIPDYRIISIPVFLGLLFALYRIAVRISKGTLIVKILRSIRHLYKLDDLK